VALGLHDLCDRYRGPMNGNVKKERRTMTTDDTNGDRIQDSDEERFGFAYYLATAIVADARILQF
jgi:hypothetical protein